MKLRKWIGAFLLVIATGVGAVLYLKQPHTSPLASPGIASLEQLTLGGIDQWILVRGEDRESPVLLFLHGGPGMPAMYLAHAFQRPLEKDFVVVHWDRRGAGKTYTESLQPQDLRVGSLLSDTRELVDHLRQRFDERRIYLVGHSFGSYLGTLFAQRHPELLHAFVGVGQVVDEEAALEIQERFIREEARRRGNTEAIEQIESRGVGAYENWLFEFGAELHESTSMWPLVWTGIKAPEYSLSDVMKVPKGSGFSSRYMEYDVTEGPLIEAVTELEVPVWFFMGEHEGF